MLKVLTYDVNSHASVYSETMFARNTSQSQYGPSGSFFELAKTNCANPLLTAQEAEAAMKQVKGSRLYLIPASPDTRGHGTTANAKFYTKELAAFLQDLAQ